MKKHEFFVCALFALPLMGGCAPKLTGMSLADGSSLAHYSGTGGVVLSKKKEGPVICVAPPAQSAIVEETRVEGKSKVDVPGTFSIDTEFSRDKAEALVRLYEQNERTLFLQYSMYRLCEAYMNGMLEGATANSILGEQLAMQQSRINGLHLQQLSCEGELRAELDAGEARAAPPSPERKRAEERLTRACQSIASDVATAEARAAVLMSQMKTDPNATLSVGNLYWVGFEQIMKTSVELAKVDAEQAKLRAEVRVNQEAARADKATKERDEARKTNEAQKVEAEKAKAKIVELETKICNGCKAEDKKAGDKKDK